MSEFQFSQEAAEKAATDIATITASIERIKQEMDSVIQKIAGVWSCESATAKLGDISKKTAKMDSRYAKYVHDHLKGSHDNYANNEEAQEELLKKTLALFRT